ncbi:hypothetical protein JCM8097_002179 [Rhodosporidiobolus ruineniae]
MASAAVLVSSRSEVGEPADAVIASSERSAATADGISGGSAERAVPAASLQAALANLASSSSGVASPRTLPPLVTPATFSSTHSAPLPAHTAAFPSAASATPAFTHPTSPSTRSRSTSRRRSRISAFKDRFNASRTFSSSSPSPSPNEQSGDGRPKQRRRFSRSLSLLQGDTPVISSAGSATAQATTTAPRWKDKSKLKLQQLLSKTPPSGSSSPPTAPSTSKARRPSQLELPIPSPPAANGPHRSNSRGRAYSAPLLLNRPPAEEPEETLAFVDAPSEPIPLLRIDSTTSSAYATAVSSPVSADFASSAVAVVEPEPEPEPEPDRFALLPRELQLRILAALVEVCAEEWKTEVREGRWKGKKARERWSEGEARGRRELIKVGRVSKTFRSLSLDGQLWPSVPLPSVRGADTVSADALLALAKEAGPFVRTLDLKGMGSRIEWKVLQEVGAALGGPEGRTGLTTIDLTGCTSITSFALSNLITASPSLSSLTVYGLSEVNSAHMVALGKTCPHLTSLTVSRCRNLRAQQLLHLAYPLSPKRRFWSDVSPTFAPTGLKTLHAAALPGMTDAVLAALFERYPALETLDVSFSERITDDGLKRAVTVAPPIYSLVTMPTSTATATARRDSARHSSGRPSQSGSSSSLSPTATPFLPSVPDDPPFARVFSSLRSLTLSGCPLLSSAGLAHLAGNVPFLEILELSRIGVALTSDGLVQLLSSTPKLRKLDLEDASLLTDDVLVTLAQHAPELSHLVINLCTEFTPGGIDTVARQCPKLRVLEADGTAISAQTAEAFVDLARARALKAQGEAAARKTGGEEDDPLVRARYPAVLSILDDRAAGRRLSRRTGGGEKLRPRHGQRRAWTEAVGFYFDGESDDEAGQGGAGGGGADKRKGAFHECDDERVVVRSYYSSLMVDAAAALRREKEDKEKKRAEAAVEGKPGLLRSRAMSDTEVLRRERSGGTDGGTGCVVS